MSLTIAAPPRATSMVSPTKDQTGVISYLIQVVWDNWITKSIVARLQLASQLLTDPPILLTSQNASITPTNFPLPDLQAGQYRVSWYARITTPATTGAGTSSLTVTIGWTETGQPLSASGAAMTGNSVTTVQAGSVLIDVDQATPISYATTYASNTASQMTYRLRLVLEQVN